jgi:hypothetical protein
MHGGRERRAKGPIRHAKNAVMQNDKVLTLTLTFLLDTTNFQNLINSMSSPGVGLAFVLIKFEN